MHPPHSCRVQHIDQSPRAAAGRPGPSQRRGFPSAVRPGLSGCRSTYFEADLARYSGSRRAARRRVRIYTGPSRVGTGGDDRGNNSTLGVTEPSRAATTPVGSRASTHWQCPRVRSNPTTPSSPSKVCPLGQGMPSWEQSGQGRCTVWGTLSRLAVRRSVYSGFRAGTRSRDG